MSFRFTLILIHISCLPLSQFCYGKGGLASGHPDGNIVKKNSGVDDSNYEYGVDISWPMHYPASSKKEFYSPRQKERYQDYMKGCSELWSLEACSQQEKERLEMNLKQPRTMQNYTNAGFAKIKAPKEAMKVLNKFWQENSVKKKKVESWPPGNIYTNHWDISTKLLRLGDETLDGGGIQDRRTIIASVQRILENWSRQPLIPTSMYGIRIYSDGAILSPHVDRLPLVISAIINVAQDVEENWILELIGHNGLATNITMEPGDMVLYEGTSVIHGRPYPLQGKYYANIFLHFEPIGHTERHSPQRSYVFDSKNDRLKNKFHRALERAQTKQKQPKQSRSGNNFPYYILDEKQKSMWNQDFVFVRDETTPGEKEDKLRSTSEREAHIAAAEGKLGTLKALLAENPELLRKTDHNGWEPIHEASRAGKTVVVEYLIEQGVDINVRTNRGRGGSPLWWAEHMLRENHPTIRLLKQHGAQKVGPD